MFTQVILRACNRVFPFTASLNFDSTKIQRQILNIYWVYSQYYSQYFSLLHLSDYFSYKLHCRLSILIQSIIKKKKVMLFCRLNNLVSAIKIKGIVSKHYFGKS